MTGKAKCFVLAGLVASVLAGSLVAQKPMDTAMVPSQLVSAKKVFISNVVGDDLRSDDPSQVYRAFFTAIKGWGRYEIVSAPADADLIFEISFREPIVGVAITGTVPNVPVGGSFTDPHLRLVILDPKTHVSLWWFTAHVRPPVFSTDDSVGHAIAELVSQAKQVASKD